MRKRIFCLILALLMVLPFGLVSAQAAGDDVVIVLDPGHGGSDGGTARKYDGVLIKESDLNLAIAQSCRDYLLENYENVKVYMTRDTDKKVSLEDRVRIAGEKQADYMLSIHINADDGRARGALAIVPRGRYHPEQGKASKRTAEAILENMAELGMKNLGTTVQLGTNRYPDGTYVDTFAVIRGCVRKNIPCIIMEHGFLDNEAEYREFLSTPAQLAALAEADALGLAQTLGLVEKSQEPPEEPPTEPPTEPPAEPPVDPPEELPEMPFIDVPKEAWYYDEVYYVWAEGLVRGVSDTEFAPDEAANRAMVVTLLYRLDGAEGNPETSGFSDVEPGSWYHAPVEWALEHGITNGISETEFAPMQNVTREQFVTFLHRYAGEPEPADTAGQFRDWADVSEFAGKAMTWAVEEGLLKGYDDGTARPKQELNRAELAALMMRFHQWLIRQEEGEIWTLSHTEKEMKTGESFELILTNQFGETAQVEWTADCDGVVKINGSTITAVGEGTVFLSCEWEGEYFYCMVEVREEEVTWTISHTDVSIKVGESFRLRLRSSDGQTADVNWSASKSGYVTIDGNKITGKKAGTVHVTCQHEGTTYKCIVRVKGA